MEPILNVENLQKYYGARGSVTRAIDDFSFRVNEGEFVGIMSGSIIIEQIFGIPGVGPLYVSSITAATPDYNFFMLLSAFYTLIGLLSGIIVDISYGLIDPRIRMGSKK